MSLPLILAALLGYLLGSFPTGLLAGLAMARVDVRKMGSGRTGGTNVYRSAGRNAAIVTILGDAGKGALAVLLARMLWGDDPAASDLTAALAALFAVVGHNHSLFLRFQGGAGTMTGAGTLAALHPIVFLLSVLLPILFTYITRMSSIGSLLYSAMGLLLGSVLIWQGYLPAASLLFFVPFFLLSWSSHRPNIGRLRQGTERRLGEKAQVAGGTSKT